jgi:serine/threonine protein kinase
MCSRTMGTGRFLSRYSVLCVLIHSLAQPSNLHANRTITTLLLRAPESYLGAEWDKPADIWSFGCLVYELVTSQSFFRYKPNEKFGLTETENMLYQMMLHSEEVFRAQQLNVSPLASEFFDSDCESFFYPSYSVVFILF